MFHTFQKQNVLLIFLAGVSIGCSSITRRTEQTDPNLKIIDAHLHTHFKGTAHEWSGRFDSRESLLKEMAENNVVGAVSHTELYEKDYHPGLDANGIIHCAGVGPKIQVARLEKGLKAGHFRCIKIYLGYVAQYASDKNYDPVYSLAAKYKVPVVFHTGDTYDKDGLLKYSDPLTIDEVAVKHRGVNFVIAHMGNPWIQSAAEVAYKNPNVYIDVSALLIGDLTKTSAEDMEEYVVKPIRWAFGYAEDPGKLMFGTDWPLADMKSYIAAVKRAIPREHWSAVFHDNAVKVFNLRPVAAAGVPAGGGAATVKP